MRHVPGARVLNYHQGCWDTLTFILNYLNTLETNSVLKKDVFGDLMMVTPDEVFHAMRGNDEVDNSCQSPFHSSEC